MTIRTDRLLLRPWRPQDREPFARLNADPRVMAHFPAPLTRTESDALADRLQAQVEEQGWGLWALQSLEALPDGDFLGFVGLRPMPAELPCAPGVEIAWRLDFPHWGKGYALEAARAALAFGFHELELAEIVAFTAVGNRRSWGLMERLGMKADGCFEHPALPPGHPLRLHRLYRLDRQAADEGGQHPADAPDSRCFP